MDTPATYPHIETDAQGVVRLSGSTMKVVYLVAERHAYGWSPEELHFQHPHLSLGQIHSALAYYWDHREQLDAELQRRLEQVEAVQAATAEPEGLRDRLRSRREHR